MKSQLQIEVEKHIKAQGFEHFGFAELEKPFSLQHYVQWIDDNKHGDMIFLKDHLEQKKEPELLLAKAQTAIVISQDYFPHPAPTEKQVFKSEQFAAPQVAIYAQGEDYHHWFKEKLTAIASSLKEQFSKYDFLAFTDSSPVLERDLAYKAGLGWFGKNTCLIHPKRGSLFFIGEIYTSISRGEFAAQSLVPDRCGTCTRCIDACPTDALNERDLDARKCISYWTIESKKVAPKELYTNFSTNYFGCDICQTVCPWNLKVFGKDSFIEKETDDSRDLLIEDLRLILDSSNKQIQKMFRASALSRASGNAHKRNAMYIVGNLKIRELKSNIENYIGKEHRLEALAKEIIKEL